MNRHPSLSLRGPLLREWGISSSSPSSRPHFILFIQILGEIDLFLLLFLPLLFILPFLLSLPLLLLLYFVVRVIHLRQESRAMMTTTTVMSNTKKVVEPRSQSILRRRVQAMIRQARWRRTRQPHKGRIRQPHEIRFKVSNLMQDAARELFVRAPRLSLRHVGIRRAGYSSVLDRAVLYFDRDGCLEKGARSFKMG